MLLRSTLIYAPAILLTRLSALLLLVIATRLIDTTEYGLLTLVVTVGELTDSAVTNWLRIALLRLGGKGDISRGSVMLAARVLLVTTLAGLVLASVAAGLIVPERWVDFAIAVGVYLAVGAVSRFGLTLLQMQQRHSVYSMLEFLRAILQLILPVAAIAIFHDSFLMVSLASSVATLCAGVVALWYASGRVVAGPPRFTYRELFALGIPLMAMAVVGFGINNAERVLLKLYYDAGAVAVFAATYALARQPIDTVANAINMGAFPEMVARFDSHGQHAAAEFISHQMALMARLCFPIVAMLIALSHEIGVLLLPAEYHAHVGELFPIIALGVLATNFSSFGFENMFHAHKKPWLLIVAMLPASALTIVLSIVLIPNLAEVGAALALLGGALASLLASMLLSRLLTPIPLPYRELGIALGTAVATGVAAWVAAALTGDAWVVFKLAAGSIAGGLVFLGLQSLLHPAETRAIIGQVRSKLGMA
ncbi:lipopolysaccharide biosynthesis protein [Devosia sp. CN2-171]|uniref:lipopolysaccharide biosynthesis protein n=1 Tax=Devosia sp. CN2-171 TaxID=3400909 RepID=UPI003BF88990